MSIYAIIVPPKIALERWLCDIEMWKSSVKFYEHMFYSFGNIKYMDKMAIVLQTPFQNSFGMKTDVFWFWLHYLVFIKGPNEIKPAVVHTGDEPLSEAFAAQFIYAYLRHSGSINERIHYTFLFASFQVSFCKYYS